MKMDSTYLSYFVIVSIFCDQFFFCCYSRFLSHCIESRNPVYLWMLFLFPLSSFWFERLLYSSYAPTHCALLFLAEKSPCLSVYTTHTVAHGHKEVFVIWSLCRYLCYHWDCSTFIKPDGNEVDENGICRIGHWFEQTGISRKRRRGKVQGEIWPKYQIFTTKSSHLNFSIFAICNRYNHYFKIWFKIICFENLRAYSTVSWTFLDDGFHSININVESTCMKT